MKKTIEKHISVLPEMHERLSKLAAKQKRSMRATLDLMITEAEKKGLKNA